MVASLEIANGIINQQQLQIEELAKQLASSQRKLSILQHQVEQLLRRIYGRRSEKLDPNQLIFDCMLETLVQAGQPEEQEERPVCEKKITHRTKRSHPGRVPIPEHLERVEIVLDIPAQEKVCPETGKDLKLIGWELSEKLEYRPGKLIVNVYKRPKYVSPDGTADGGVITAPMPDSPIEKCKADIGLLSHIIVSKFADHLPFYRQDGLFKREGVDIPRATQGSWCLKVYEAISPLEEVLKRVILESDNIFTDDSIIPLLAKGNGKVKKGRLWVYVRGGPGPPLSIFDFSPDRSQKRPLSFLEGYQGYIHADAYSGYDQLFLTDGIIEVACWAHTRRKFDEAVKSRPKEATDIMVRIAQL